MATTDALGKAKAVDWCCACNAEVNASSATRRMTANTMAWAVDGGFRPAADRISSILARYFRLSGPLLEERGRDLEEKWCACIKDVKVPYYTVCSVCASKVLAAYAAARE